MRLLGRRCGDDPDEYDPLHKQLVRLMGCKAFIPKVNWQTRQFAKFCRKGMHLFSLLADFSGHRQGIADHDPLGVKTTAEPRDRPQILALISTPFKGQNRLGREPKFVRDGNTDAFRTHVERKIARNCRPGQLTYMSP